MSLKDLRWPVVAVCCFVVFSLLLGGQRLYQKYYVERPLTQHIQAVTGVQEVHFEGKQGNRRLVVRLGVVPDFQQTYTELLNVTRSNLNNKQVELVIMDRRSAALTSIWRDAQFAIYEAMINGNLSQMKEAVYQEAQQAGSTCVLYLDKQNIYVQLQQGECYLYEAVPWVTSTLARDTSTIALRAQGGDLN